MTSQVAAMTTLKVTLVLVGLVMAMTEASKDVMLALTKTFAKPVQACKEEMGLPESVSQDFMNFWKEGFHTADRLTGCAIMCMSSKLDLLDGEYRLHHGKAQEFAKQHGADEAKAKELVDMIHACGQVYPEGPDPCDRAIKISMCFKAKIHELDWAPDVELIVAELLAET